jgi:hypothetical protein
MARNIEEDNKRDIMNQEVKEKEKERKKEDKEKEKPEK